MLEEKIMNDYKEAMKSRDAVRSSTLNFLRAEMMNVAIAKKKKALDDTDIIAIIRKQIKQRQDSIEQFKKGSRQDLADKEILELEILKPYLPPELSAEEIKEVMEGVIAANPAQGLKDMGRVMKEIMAKLPPGSDAKAVSDLVKERLSK